MKLDDWLWANKLRRSAFAEMAQISKGYVTNLCDGKVRPSLEMAQRIAAVTNGQVQPQDFYIDEPQPPEAA